MQRQQQQQISATCCHKVENILRPNDFISSLFPWPFSCSLGQGARLGLWPAEGVGDELELEMLAGYVIKSENSGADGWVARRGSKGFLRRPPRGPLEPPLGTPLEPAGRPAPRPSHQSRLGPATKPWNMLPAGGSLPSSKDLLLGRSPPPRVPLKRVRALRGDEGGGQIT